MVDRTWTGAVDNNASTPGNWSPSGQPQAGDILTAGPSTVTMDITGNALAGNTLQVEGGYGIGPDTFNLSHNATVSLDLGAVEFSNVVDVSGRDTLNSSLG
jgi:hypothetical protein